MPTPSALTAVTKRNRAGSYVCGAALMASTGFALALTVFSPDALIANGFDHAFATLAANQSAAARVPAAFNGVSGSEDDWLRSSASHEIVKVVSIGQQIRLSDKGAERHLVITNVTDGGDAATHIDTSPVSPRVLLITCRDEDDQRGREIRLRLEGGRISQAAADPVLSAL